MSKTTIVMGQVPPQDLEIEAAVLGAILLQKDVFAVANNLIGEDVFYTIAHKSIFKACKSLFNKGESIDILTVWQELKSMGLNKDVESPAILTNVTKHVVSGENIEFHCRILLELYLKRSGIEIANKLLIESFDTSVDVFESFNGADAAIINAQERVMKGLLKDSNYYAKKVYEDYETVKATGVLGIKTNIRPIDEIMCGLVAPDLIIVAARPGMGKTGLAISITKNLSIDQKMPGAWFSYEMSGTQLMRRLVSQVSNISHQAIRQGSVFEHNETKLIDAIEQVSNAPIFINDDPSININDLRAKATILKKRHDIKYLIVDYLQLMPTSGSRNKNREQEVSDISRGLKSIAKQLDIPVIALSQLSRGVESRGDKMPQLSDLRESGAIEQDADSILFLMRPEYYGMMEPVFVNQKEYDVRGLCLGINGKNRHGKTANFAMWFDGPIMDFRTHPNDAYIQVENKEPVLELGYDEKPF